MIRSEIILVPVSFFTQINAECIRIKINVSTSRNIRLLRLIGVEDGNETCFCPMDTNPEIKIKLQARVFIQFQGEFVSSKYFIDGATETRSR